jgi:orotate phosphoribosyltransferase
MIRDAAKEYGTANRIEGPFEEGEQVHGGGHRDLRRALLAAIEAARSAGLVVRTAVCVVDREEGGQTRSRARPCVCGRCFGQETC